MQAVGLIDGFEKNPLAGIQAGVGRETAAPRGPLHDVEYLSDHRPEVVDEINRECARQRCLPACVNLVVAVEDVAAAGTGCQSTNLHLELAGCGLRETLHRKHAGRCAGGNHTLIHKAERQVTAADQGAAHLQQQFAIGQRHIGRQLLAPHGRNNAGRMSHFCGRQDRLVGTCVNRWHQRTGDRCYRQATRSLWQKRVGDDEVAREQHALFQNFQAN